MKKLILFFCLIVASDLSGQTFSNKVVGKKNTEYADSIKNSEYPYILPILGKKATKAGFTLPYSAGFGINYLWQKSDLIINNLQVGFNNGPKYNFDDLITFNSAISESNGLNFRPDIWILPFLNIYGIFAKSNTSTTIDCIISVPDSDSWNEIANLKTTAKFNASTIGFGTTATIGVGGGWLALDMNFSWSDIDELSKPVYTFIFDPRIGKAFKLKKEQVIAVWVGGFRLKLNTGTEGSIPLGDLFSADELNTKIETGQAKVEDSQQQVDTWWSNLTPVEQNNPVNKAKYETANNALAKAGGILSSAADAVDRIGTSSVQYSLDKKPKDIWNFLVGGQYQLNKHWMLRGEYGFLSSRHSFIGGLQYRFGL